MHVLSLRALAILPVFLTFVTFCTTTQKKVVDAQGKEVPQRTETSKKIEIGGIEKILANPVEPSDRARIVDCREYSAATMWWRSETPHFDIFNDSLNDQRKFYITEQGGWPFVIGYHHLTRVKPDTTWIVALRGESSGFHSTSVAKPILKMLEDLPGAAMITVDEYKYNGRTVGEQKVLHPICHRTYYRERKIGTESPGFENGGALKLMRRILPSPNQVILMSYSNATTPRGEFLVRDLKDPEEKINYKLYGNPKLFLDSYIEKTNFNSEVYPAIKGFIDIEGNYEYNKALWDLLAFIKLEIEPDPNRFYYSAVRIEKFDAYPVQTTMIRALELKGVEDSEGVIRFTNPAGNVIIDIITNHFQPYYYGVGGDIRRNTNMIPATNVRRTNINHYMMGPFIHRRLLYTTPFLKKEMQLLPAVTSQVVQ
jgi:hypothetical protein